MAKFEAFSEAQSAVIHHGWTDDTIMLAGGAIRSGKTTASIIGFTIWLLKKGLENDHALIGQSIESAMRNVGFDLIDFMESIGVSASFNRALGSRIVVRHEGKSVNIWIIGAGDERAQKRLQGATLKGVIADEAALYPESFFFQALGRMSVEGCKMWLTFNPETPRHWLKVKVVDRSENFNGILVHFDMDDNPSLSDAVKKRYRDSFIGHWKKRMIEGQWAGASGLIFPVFDIVEDPAPDNWKTHFAIDWGVSSVFAALCFAQSGMNAIAKAEMYYDARLSEPRSEAEHLEAFCAWAEGLDGIGSKIWLDPSTPYSFKRALRKRGFMPRDADNEVLAGLTGTAARLQQRQVKIHKDCENLIKEMYSYQWDDKKSDKGLDAPVKADDHAVDALRYFCYNTGKAYNHIKPMTIRKSGLRYG